MQPTGITLRNRTAHDPEPFSRSESPDWNTAEPSERIKRRCRTD
jgi:hypothetical protein